MRRYGQPYRGTGCDCCGDPKDGRVHEKRFGEMIVAEHLELLRPHACDGSVGLFCSCELADDDELLGRHMVDVTSHFPARPLTKRIASE